MGLGALGLGLGLGLGPGLGLRIGSGVGVLSLSGMLGVSWLGIDTLLSLPNLFHVPLRVSSVTGDIDEPL